MILQKGAVKDDQQIVGQRTAYMQSREVVTIRQSKISANALRQGSVFIKRERYGLQALSVLLVVYVRYGFSEGRFGLQRFSVEPRSRLGGGVPGASWCGGDTIPAKAMLSCYPSAVTTVGFLRLDLLSCCQITQHLLKPRKRRDSQ